MDYSPFITFSQIYIKIPWKSAEIVSLIFIPSVSLLHALFRHSDLEWSNLGSRVDERR